MHLITIITALTTLLAATALAKKPNQPAPSIPLALPPVRIATHHESSCTHLPATVYLNPNACFPFPNNVEGLQVIRSSDEHLGDQSSEWRFWLCV
jgi:hypothetical protein